MVKLLYLILYVWVEYTFNKHLGADQHMWLNIFWQTKLMLDQSFKGQFTQSQSQSHTEVWNCHHPNAMEVNGIW